MIHYAPSDYVCPFCQFISGKETEYNKFQDIVYQDNFTLSFLSPKWWKNNPGNLLVIPKKHYENIYSIPGKELSDVYSTAKKIAIALKEVYQCDGTSMRQHNEPAGNQDIWHFHVHVFPRYKDDNFYRSESRFTEPSERIEYGEKLRKYFSDV